ncbi:CLUMA_CG010049, isoform A [Clunio marinus]|uniref:CLUMA_CG010049, isoform A n=1 Tax=Clunio marinus TaxID=568069 RepID=A0A1J1I8K8_9DIPT|nr:CLUMA_CG010049, isoform A [Clunio marinus]
MKFCLLFLLIFSVTQALPPPISNDFPELRARIKRLRAVSEMDIMVACNPLSTTANQHLTNFYKALTRLSPIVGSEATNEAYLSLQPRFVSATSMCSSQNPSINELIRRFEDNILRRAWYLSSSFCVPDAEEQAFAYGHQLFGHFSGFLTNYAITTNNEFSNNLQYGFDHMNLIEQKGGSERTPLPISTFNYAFSILESRFVNVHNPWYEHETKTRLGPYDISGVDQICRPMINVPKLY